MARGGPPREYRAATILNPCEVKTPAFLSRDAFTEAWYTRYKRAPLSSRLDRSHLSYRKEHPYE